MDENELLEKVLWTNPGGQRGRGLPKSKGIDGVEEDARKLGCRTALRLPRIEVAGDICLRPMPMMMKMIMMMILW